ncbi:hypothetical protein Asal01_00159 [Fodinibius salicampi]
MYPIIYSYTDRKGQRNGYFLKKIQLTRFTGILKISSHDYRRKT